MTQEDKVAPKASEVTQYVTPSPLELSIVQQAMWLVLLCLSTYQLVLQSVSPSNSSPAALPRLQIDLNEASLAELRLLPRIGPKLAQRIHEYRQLHGSFESLEQLDAVSGIGPSTLDGIRPWVFVDETSSVTGRLTPMLRHPRLVVSNRDEKPNR